MKRIFSYYFLAGANWHFTATVARQRMSPACFMHKRKHCRVPEQIQILTMFLFQQQRRNTMIGARLTTAVALLAMSVVANAAQDKKLVCHVGNEAGPANETYLDDPDCIPSDLNGYFCPDAGKIDLIVVAENAAGNHLENPSHYWDGISDYDPIAMGASADVTEDIDGDGIDEGCEIAEGCPCWDAAELMQVTAANHGGGSGSFPSCSDVSYLPFLAVIQDNVTVEDGVEGGFAATRLSDGGICETRDNQVFFELSVEEASACVEQIADRCAAIGDPINNPN